MTRVILTRPAGQSRTWREALQTAGHEVLDWPLIETTAMPSSQDLDRAWLERASCQAWMFVSAPAVQHFFAQRPAGADLAGSRYWATGPGTRRALQQCGVPDEAIDAPPEDAGQFDTEHLWAAVQAQVTAWAPGQTVAIVRGTEVSPEGQSSAEFQADQAGVGRDWLAEQLTRAGVRVRWVVAYRRGPAHWDDVQCRRARQAVHDGSIWVFSSSLAADYLAELLPETRWANARAVATHDRIALVLRTQGWGRVAVCKPQASALLLRIASLESPP
jgi:uroporphyrinogen-III synthase